MLKKHLLWKYQYIKEVKTCLDKVGWSEYFINTVALIWICNSILTTKNSNSLTSFPLNVCFYMPYNSLYCVLVNNNIMHVSTKRVFDKIESLYKISNQRLKANDLKANCLPVVKYYSQLLRMLSHELSNYEILIN